MVKVKKKKVGKRALEREREGSRARRRERACSGASGRGLCAASAASRQRRKEGGRQREAEGEQKKDRRRGAELFFSLFLPSLLHCKGHVPSIAALFSPLSPRRARWDAARTLRRPSSCRPPVTVVRRAHGTQSHEPRFFAFPLSRSRSLPRRPTHLRPAAGRGGAEGGRRKGSARARVQSSARWERFKTDAEKVTARPKGKCVAASDSQDMRPAPARRRRRSSAAQTQAAAAGALRRGCAGPSAPRQRAGARGRRRERPPAVPLGKVSAQIVADLLLSRRCLARSGARGTRGSGGGAPRARPRGQQCAAAPRAVRAAGRRKRGGEGGGGSSRGKKHGRPRGDKQRLPTKNTSCAPLLSTPRIPTLPPPQRGHGRPRGLAHTLGRALARSARARGAEGRRRGGGCARAKTVAACWAPDPRTRQSSL